MEEGNNVSILQENPYEEVLSKASGSTRSKSKVPQEETLEYMDTGKKGRNPNRTHREEQTEKEKAEGKQTSLYQHLKFISVTKK